VRPWWQPDPPPIPEFETPCWVAIGITRRVLDWDPVTEQQPQLGPLKATVFRNERIEAIMAFYGRAAGDTALVFRQGTGISGNLEQLGPIKLVSVEDKITTSEYIKGRWQRRVDVGVVLRRPVQFTYGQPEFVGVYGTIYSEEIPPIDFDARAPLNKKE